MTALLQALFLLAVGAACCALTYAAIVGLLWFYNRKTRQPAPEAP